MKPDGFGYERREPAKGQPCHVWWLKRGGDAVHIWAQYTERNMFGEHWYGGYEKHSPRKEYDFQSDAAPIEDCWLTGCDCWPDGSSMAFDTLRPMLDGFGPDDDIKPLTSFVECELVQFFNAQFEHYDMAEVQ